MSHPAAKFGLSLILGIAVLLSGCSSVQSAQSSPVLSSQHQYSSLDLSQAGSGVTSSIV